MRRERDATERGVTIELAGAPAHCCGDRHLLELLVANLVENGLRYNEPRGFLRLETDQHEHNVRLRVTNSGEIVPADY